MERWKHKPSQLVLVRDVLKSSPARGAESFFPIISCHFCSLLAIRSKVSVLGLVLALTGPCLVVCFGIFCTLLTIAFQFSLCWVFGRTIFRTLTIQWHCTMQDWRVKDKEYAMYTSSRYARVLCRSLLLTKASWLPCIMQSPEACCPAGFVEQIKCGSRLKFNFEAF